MKGHGEKLTRKQELAVAALLVQPTMAEAARVVGIGEVTLWRWMQQPEFQTRYRDARRQAVSQAIAQLQQVAGDAVKTLADVMNDADKPASSRVAAAKAVLEMAVKAIELEDLEARVAALEQQAGPEVGRGGRRAAK